MIRLDFELSLSELRNVVSVDLTSASRTDLDYFLFCGSIVFRIDGATFDAPWGWIPIFDFATQLRDVVDRLEREASSVLEFTESEAAITFIRNDSVVRVVANYVDDSAEIPFDELRLAAKQFLFRVVSELVARWPTLAVNPHIKDTISQD